MQPLPSRIRRIVRIALAIQVITAKKLETPALIFDEVDVGISGRTAAVARQIRRVNSANQLR